jgi:hypothetical protein
MNRALTLYGGERRAETRPSFSATVVASELSLSATLAIEKSFAAEKQAQSKDHTPALFFPDSRTACLVVNYRSTLMGRMTWCR